MTIVCSGGRWVDKDRGETGQQAPFYKLLSAQILSLIGPLRLSTRHFRPQQTALVLSRLRLGSPQRL